MDTSNWRPPQGGEPPLDSGDWRSQLQNDSRQRIVNKIMETLKRHLPVSGNEGLSELRKIAVRFEEKIYTAATSQSDYLRKISLKMLTMETKSQSSMGNPLPSNSMVPSNKPLDTASQSMPSQAINQSTVPLSSNQPQSRQQLLSQNIQNTIAPQSSSSLPSAVPPVTGLAPSSMPTMVGQSSSMQSVSGVSQNVGNTVGQGVPSNVFPNSQRPIQGRQVVSQQQQQQSQSQQQYLYQHQLQQQLIKQKYQQGSMSHQLMQPHMSQQQQNLIQPNQLQSSQQSVLQTSSVMQPSVMQPSLSNLQQSQQSPIQQPTQSMLQQPSQPVLRQQQQSQPHAAMHQQPTMPQQTMLPSQQQQQLISQQPNSSNMQQNSLIGQQSSLGDMQQQLPQQSRSHGQQSNLSNMQSPPSQQQQQLMTQQNNLSNLQQQQQQQLGPQSNVSGLQQQIHGTQSGNSNMQTNQHSVHMLHQNKVQMQQQPPPNTSNLLSTQGQQGQLQPSQQLMSQIPLQSTQVQQQVPLQQQQQPPNVMSHELQQRLQVSGQAPGSLLQPQNVMDQQKQVYHSQRALPETSSTSLDSTAQTGQANAGDWQEEIYQKIKAMKELYFFELKEMYQKILPKLNQFDSLPQQPKLEQLNKLKAFKSILERLLAFLQVPKSNIVLGFKDKIGHYEKQIVSFLNSNRPRNPVSTLQPGQLPASHMHSIQQSQSQMTSLQSPENQINSQLHSANMQCSVAPVQQNNMNNMQHNSLSSFSGSAAQQNMTSPMQPGSGLESGQGNSLSSLQQVAAGSLQQNPANTSQRANSSSLSSQNGVNPLQQNISALQSNPNMLQHQHLKQQDPQQLMQSPQQLKQQLQQRHIHQLKQQMLQQHQQQQQQPQSHQQQSQLHQQGKQQLPTQMQMQAHQMSHLNPINEINDLKMRQGLAVKPGMFQHLPATQRSAYSHPQLKPGTSFPISPPIFQAASPQVAQNSSPQVDQQSLLSSITKTGTPLQSASSPFVVPSPSTSPVAPSPIPGDSEKPMSAVSSLTNAGNTGQQTSVSGTQAQSLAIGTPGISASPLLAEFSGTDGSYVNALPTVSGKSNVTEQPLERLIKAVKSMSPKALSASVSGIGSVVSMIDRIAGSAPGNGSRAAVGEDLVAMTKCRLQARNFVSHDGLNGTKKMRRYTSAMPLNVVSSAGSVNDVFKPLTGAETSDLESTATSSVKRPRVEANHVLLEEIREINQRLIDTVVVISDEVVDPSALVAAADGSEGTIVKCSFSAVALSPNLKSQYASAQMSPIQPLRLLVPTNYPNCSPILLDKFPVEVSKEYEDLSIKAKSRFSISLRNLSQPMSLGEIARTWDVCARAVVSEYAQQSGGGSFCSKYGAWENCLSAA
ncbi:mediator of RNA polymerase II transcription subunit 15a [Momordica charantia]|uniref:Mediator of RNA polymerase II transcription subunit 15a n=1 Tax=Momordica charantia TaxID=3673 RepID=A0A6J1DNN0_MOMCH|nr:mediator of RNA polymerase II transcription subunit 15a [Momordica charantia]